MTFVPADHPDARAEYLHAVAYYDEERAGLGDALIDRFENAIQEILRDPAAWPKVPGWDEQPVLRSRRVKDFHYRVVYYVRDEQVRVIAYAHTSREPNYWKARVGDR